MVWSRTDSWMVTADHGGYVKYWQSNMNNVKMFQAHKEPVRAIRWEQKSAGDVSAVLLVYLISILRCFDYDNNKRQNINIFIIINTSSHDSEIFCCVAGKIKAQSNTENNEYVLRSYKASHWAPVFTSLFYLPLINRVDENKRSFEPNLIEHLLILIMSSCQKFTVN